MNRSQRNKEEIFTLIRIARSILKPATNGLYVGVAVGVLGIAIYLFCEFGPKISYLERLSRNVLLVSVIVSGLSQVGVGIMFADSKSIAKALISLQGGDVEEAENILRFTATYQIAKRLTVSKDTENTD